jgi:hypothetical protein
VQVGRDRGDLVDPEVPGRDRPAQRLDPRQDEAADAGVDVQRQVVARGDGAQRGDGVDHAVRVLRGRADQQDRAPGDGPGHGVHVGAQVGPDLDLAQAQPEVVRGLVERRVDGARHDDLGPADPRPVPARVVTVGAQRHQQRLGPARGDGADGAGRAVQQRRRHLDHLGLEPAQAAEGDRVEQVAAGVAGVGGGQQPLVIVAGVIDQREDPSLAPGRVVGLASGQRGQHVAGRFALVGDGAPGGHRRAPSPKLASSWSEVMLLWLRPRKLVGGVVTLSVTSGTA